MLARNRREVCLLRWLPRRWHTHAVGRRHLCGADAAKEPTARPRLARAAARPMGSGTPWIFSSSTVQGVLNDARACNQCRGL